MFARLLIILVLFVSTSAFGAPVIMVYGDSLSAGYGLPENTGWVSLLARRLEQQKLSYQVVNASISGETTQGGLYRIEEALNRTKPVIVIMELGANDGLRGLPLDVTRSNLESIIQACRQRKVKILLVGMRLPPNYGRAYTEKFQNIYLELSRRYKLPLVPFLLEGFADRRELFQADNVHPNVAAQPLILNNVWIRLKPMLKTGSPMK